MEIIVIDYGKEKISKKVNVRNLKKLYIGIGSKIKRDVTLDGNILIGNDVKINKKTSILSSVSILDKSEIGKDVVIGFNT